MTIGVGGVFSRKKNLKSCECVSVWFPATFEEKLSNYRAFRLLDGGGGGGKGKKPFSMNEWYMKTKRQRMGRHDDEKSTVTSSISILIINFCSSIFLTGLFDVFNGRAKWDKRWKSSSPLHCASTFVKARICYPRAQLIALTIGEREARRDYLSHHYRFGVGGTSSERVERL
jgi:hypothetical protein